MTGNDNSGMKTLDDTDARDPLVPLSRPSECEHLVNLMVSDVAGNHGIERWNGEHGARPRGIAQ